MSKRSHLAAPYVARAHLADVRNPVDGRRYTCRHAYERAVKAAGCEIVGKEAAVPQSTDRKVTLDVGRDLKRAWEQLET